MSKELLEAPIKGLVLAKAGAMAVGIVGIMVFTVVDTWFIALLGTDALAAMSFIMPITFIVSSFAMGMSMGMASVMGRLLGGNDQNQAKGFVTDGLILSVIVVALIAGLGLITIEPLFLLLGAEPELIPLIHSYIFFWYLAIPLLVIPMVGNSAIRATGDVKTPSMVMLFAGGVNALLDPLFIFTLEMGMRGAAVATAVSWLLTFVVAAYMLAFKLNLIERALPPFRRMKDNWKQLLTIGIPASVSQMLNPLANTIVVAMLAVYGVAAVAALGVGARVESLLLIFALAVSVVVPIVFGQNYGAKQFKRAGASIRYSFNLVIGIHVVLYGFIFFTAPMISGWFSNDPEVIQLSTLYLQILPLSYALQGVALVITMLLNTLHRPMTSLAINGIRLFVFLLPGAWLGGQINGAIGLFWGIAISQIIAGLGLYFYGLNLIKSVESEGELDSQQLATA